MLEVGKKYVPRNYPNCMYVQVDGVTFEDSSALCTVYYHDRPACVAEWHTSGRVYFPATFESAWDLVAEYQGSSVSRSCSLGCDLVDSGMKWTFCRACETQYEFKNWEWVAMRKAT